MNYSSSAVWVVKDLPERLKTGEIDLGRKIKEFCFIHRSRNDNLNSFLKRPTQNFYVGLRSEKSGVDVLSE